MLTNNVQPWILAGFDDLIFKGFESQGVLPAVWFKVGPRGMQFSGSSRHKENVETYSWADITEFKFLGISGQSLGEDRYLRLEKEAFDVFARCYSRTRVTRQFEIFDWIDCKSEFIRSLDFFYNILTRNKIKLVVFSNVPHEGPFILLYYLCLDLGVRTVILMQSLFPKRFFIFHKISDLGQFDTAPVRRQNFSDIEFDKKPRPLFYMKGSFLIPCWRFRVRLFALKMKLVFRLFGGDSNDRKFRKSMFRIGELVGRYHLQRHKSLASFDNRVNYVYFPLQLQPEMTTDVLGGEYSDQLLALERLHRLLPEDWVIYVKENPKQTNYFRPESFFQRLGNLSRVYYLPIGIDSLELIRHCRFVMTITGTAGWEAIRMGKPALIFGQAWYKRFPGVFEWRNGFDLDAMMRCDISADSIRFAVDALGAHLREGVLDYDYLAMTGDLDLGANGVTIAAQINDFIRDSCSTHLKDLSPYVSHV